MVIICWETHGEREEHLLRFQWDSMGNKLVTRYNKPVLSMDP